MREGVIHADSWVYNDLKLQNKKIEFGFIDNKDDAILENVIPIYFTAFYFVTATMS